MSHGTDLTPRDISCICLGYAMDIMVHTMVSMGYPMDPFSHGISHGLFPSHPMAHPIVSHPPPSYSMTYPMHNAVGHPTHGIAHGTHGLKMRPFFAYKAKKTIHNEAVFCM